MDPQGIELSNRAKFKAVLNHLEALKDLVKAGFKGHYTKTGGYRAAFAYNPKNAISANETGFMYLRPNSGLAEAVCPERLTRRQATPTIWWK